MDDHALAVLHGGRGEGVWALSYEDTDPIRERS